VDMYFNRTYESFNLDYYFYLNVWSDNNGKPGTLLVNQPGMRPAYSDSLNRFIRYYFEKPVAVSGIFYVGWQKTVDKLENIGFDRNRISNQKIFYTDNAVWKNSMFPGSIMIRPVLSMKQVTVGGQEYFFRSSLSVYPNPADDEIRISLPDGLNNQDIVFSLYDLGGRLIRTSYPGELRMSTSDLENGLYFIRTAGPLNGFPLTSKILLLH